MANVEIYDSSNSNLSSDEYSNEEDDDALMDAAVSSKQTPTKSPKTTSPAKSNEAGGSKPQSRKPSITELQEEDGNAVKKPPLSREQTQQQIKQLQRSNKANLYYKRRSLVWLRRLNKFPDGYLEHLRRAVPQYEAHYKRMAEYRASKATLELPTSRRSDSSGSRSRSPSRSCSQSPELICLDDTENEESPEKREVIKRELTPEISAPTAAPNPTSVKLENNEEEGQTENGSILDEFLTLKTPPNDESNAIPIPNPYELTTLPVALQVAQELELEIKVLGEEKEEISLKRRRSVTPPTNCDKRSKQLQQEDDDTIEFMPMEEISEPIKPTTEVIEAPAFKLGPAFTLAPLVEQPQLQQQPVDLAALTFSLNTPTPPAVPMEISYPTDKPQNEIKLNPLPTPAPTPIFTAPQAPLQARRSETVSTQTQSTDPPPTPPPSRPPKSSPIDLNNSDANFHHNIKSLYNEYNSIMEEKVGSIKPEHKAVIEERKRTETDIKTLDKLIIQKEEEYNRLLHLRCIKEELRGRLERKERVLIIKELLPSILNKNCSTPELYEMHTLLLEEQDAPIASKQGGTALERCINKVEDSQNNLRKLRGALGLMDAPLEAPMAAPTPRPPPPHFEEAHYRRNSLPAMRPPPAAERSTNYGRSRYVMDDHPPHQRDYNERPKPPPQNRYNPQLVNSTPNLAAAGTSFTHTEPQFLKPTQRINQNSLENHFEPETNNSLNKPLSNSSPLARQPPPNRSLYNDTHSIYQPDRKKHKRAAAGGPSLTNGGNEPRRCQHCERYEATYMCASCQNQWYCSRDCQVRAWDNHWEDCRK